MSYDLQIGPLRTLVTIVDRGGFRRAAEELHISQPAVSQQVRRLAVFLKEPIFINTGRKLQLSRSGEELLQYARRIVSVNDEAVARLRSNSDISRLAIGISDQLADSLSEILQLLSRSDLDVQIATRTGTGEALEDQVAAGGLDIALLVNPSAGTSYPIQRLGRIELSWFGRPSREIGRRIPLCLFSEPSRLRDRTIEDIEACGRPWRIGYEGPDLNGVRAATRAGLGVACLVANAGELWGLPDADPRCGLPAVDPLPIGLAYATRTPSRPVQAVAEAVRTALRGYPLG